MKKSLLAMAVVSSVSYAPVSLAQQTQSDETVVVTANRFAQTVKSTTVPVEVVTRQDIERIQANNLLEVLRTLPGVQVATNGGYGQSQSLFVRGTNSNHVLVLIDGVRFGSATSGTAAISAIPLVGVERIEFLRGSRAALYGSDAIGGVINIITATTGSEHKVTATAGSDNYYSGQLLTSGNVSKKLHMSLGLSGVDTDGYSVKTSEPDRDGYRAKAISTNAHYTFNDNWNAGVMLMAARGNSEYDGTKSVGDSNETTLSNVVANLKYQGAEWQSRFSASFNQDKTDTYSSSPSRVQTDRQEFSSDHLYSLTEQLSIGGGVNWYNDDVSGTSTQFQEDSRTNLGVYLTSLYQVKLFDLAAAVRSDDNERYGQNSTWQFGAGYNIDSQYRVTANIGTAFKAPTFNELYNPRSNYGNPDVKPEESTNYEIGLLASYDWAELSLNVYRNELDNLIDRPASGEPVENVDEVVIKGVELGAMFNLGDVENRLSYDYIDAKDKNSGNNLRRRAKHSAKWNMIYQMEQWSFNMDYLFQGKRYDDASEKDKLGAYSLVDISTAYHFINGVTLSGKIGNLFDKEYQTAKGYETPDRKYYATVSYQF